MSVNPVATAQWSEIQKKGGEPGAAPAVPFEEILSAQSNPSAGAEPVSAATAAELLRLKMMSSALSLGGEQAQPAAAQSQGVQALLDKFLAQLPKGAENGAPPPPEPASLAAPLPRLPRQTISFPKIRPSPPLSRKPPSATASTPG